LLVQLISLRIRAHAWAGVLIAALFSVAGLSQAERAIDDSATLNGVKATKSVYLIDFINPLKTTIYRDIIRGTQDGLIRQGVKPNMVLVFIGE
jgi:hypothetical protein